MTTSVPLLCPFCGQVPQVFPQRPDLSGDKWAAVRCVNPTCQAQPTVNEHVSERDRSLDECKAAAIAKWNQRAVVSG